MRSPFLGYLLASVVLHLLALALPFSVTMGGLGASGTIPVRVRLLSDGTDSPAAGTAKKASPNRPGPATAGELSREAQESQERSAPREIERVSAPPKSEKPRNGPDTAVHPAPNVPRTEAAGQSAKPGKGKEKPPNTEIASARRSAQAEERRPKKRPARQAVLRTTAVYPGSRGIEAPQTSEAGAESVAAAKPGPAPAGGGHARNGSSQQAHTAPFSRVRYARVVKPEYPEQARVQGWEGTAILKVLVNQSGRSSDIRVHRSSGFNLLDDAAVEALRLWEFHPARRGPLAVQSWVSVPIVFKLEEDE